ncbi:MAG: Asp-tRNA(Asn)/Glu-tRNA(Gln) amidotransferase subunit GatC [Saprospiraceae bacterium]|nr:Asp-tRNA(Asn)/Glu-tRNA(Gln) amidotransferase subunit GatC [Saprospiraceae bacterium]
MQIDRALLLRIEHLARLELSEDSREAILQDMNKILDMVEKLNEPDTTAVEPLVYVNEATQPLRDDVTEVWDQRDAAFRNAPLSDGSFFKVPKMME